MRTNVRFDYLAHEEAFFFFSNEPLNYTLLTRFSSFFHFCFRLAHFSMSFLCDGLFFTVIVPLLIWHSNGRPLIYSSSRTNLWCATMSERKETLKTTVSMMMLMLMLPWWWWRRDASITFKKKKRWIMFYELDYMLFLLLFFCPCDFTFHL